MQNTDAPHSSLRPPSPTRQMTKLPGIPEVSPGPNAFAQQAARLERHRLDSNAFYQQEVARRRVTPPTVTHPALRSMAPPNPPALDSHGHELQRDSTMTTMSPFINAGRDFSPELRLVPSMAQVPQPTQRGCIEEQREQMAYEAAGGDGERVPVYNTIIPTPKPASDEFADTSLSKKLSDVLPKKTATGSDLTKSPKKTSFFDRLRMTKITSTSSSSMSTLTTSDAASDQVGNVPPKAQAVLGASPSKISLTRTPSKQKRGIFALRRVADTTDVKTTCATMTSRSNQGDNEEHRRTIGSNEANTPQTAYSDPMHHSYQQGMRLPSQTTSESGTFQKADVGKCMIQRSQSLKYIDSIPPPTPPAKNTPPHEKAKQDAARSGVIRPPFHQTLSTPARGRAGTISTNERVSPTKFGSYGHREVPTLVTKPSMYSLHASVVPEMCEASTFEEMKARIDGLGLEGFSMPMENYYHRDPEMTYSPSVYSDDWGTRASKGLKTPRSGHRRTMDDLPTLQEISSESDRASHRTKQSSSSGFTIPIIYPELALDPAVSGQASQLRARPVSDDAAQYYRSGPAYTARKESLAHVQPHSKNRSNSPHRAMKSSSLAADYKNSPHHTESVDSVGADPTVIPAMEDLHQLESCSPASYNNPSAMPSPLHYLPATTYTTPRSKKASPGRAANATTPSSTGRENRLGVKVAQNLGYNTPSRSTNLLADAPVLVAQQPVQPMMSTRSSPRPSFVSLTDTSETDVDPKKQNVSKAPTESVDKQDQIVAMLNRLLLQNQEMKEMRDELRASNARIDERSVRTATEDVVDMAPQPQSRPHSDQQHDAHVTENPNVDRRVATSFAHDFYRRQSTVSTASTPPNSAGTNGQATFSAASTGATTTSEAPSDTIAELQESNRQLAEMVRGFAAKLADMQKRVDGEA